MQYIIYPVHVLMLSHNFINCSRQNVYCCVCYTASTPVYHSWLSPVVVLSVYYNYTVHVFLLTVLLRTECFTVFFFGGFLK